MNGNLSLIQFVAGILCANLFNKDKRRGLLSPITNVEPQDLGLLIVGFVAIDLIIRRLALVLTPLRLMWALAVDAFVSYS